MDSKDSKLITLNYLKDTHSFKIPITYQELRKSISQKIKLSAEDLESYILKYLDDEDDYIIISNQADLDQALLLMEKQNLKSLQIFLQKKLDNSSSQIFQPSKIIQDDSKKYDFPRIVDSSLSNFNASPFKTEKIFNDNENNDFKKDINQDIKKEDFKQDIKQDLKQDIKKDPKQDLKNEKICNDSLDLENSIGIIGNIIENNNNFLEYSSDPSFNELKQNMRAFLVDLITKEFSSMKDRVLKKAIEKSEEEILKYFSKKQSQENKLLVVHTGVKCSQCGQNPIRGVRYKCNVCEDLNYCEKCEDEYGDKHQHPFLKIKVSEVDPLAKFNIAKDNNNDNQANKTINDNNLQTTVKVDKVDKKGKIAEVKDVDVNFDMRESTNLTQSFIFKNEDKFQAECISTNLKLNSKINSELRINLKLRNSGSISWPKNCILTCIKEKSDLIGVNIPLKLKVEPLKDNNIEIKLQTDDQEGNKKSVWRLKYDNFFFGDEFVFEIKVGESTKVNVEENKEDKANITTGTEPEKSKLDIDNHKDINDINHINDQNDPNKTEYSDINYINSYLDIENKGNIIINYKNIDLKDNKPDDVKEKVCEEKQKEKIKEVRDLYGLDNQNFTDDKIRTSLIASNWDMGDKFLDGLLENK